VLVEADNQGLLVPDSRASAHTVPVTDAQQRSAEFTVLFVCTGNICRSALAERLGRAYLAEVLGDEAGLTSLTSAGTGAVVGSAMHPDSALVLQGFGGDPAGFIARQVDAATLAGADLVLAMTREHRRAVLQMAPRALNRTFTLREAGALVGLLVDAEIPEGDFAERARTLVREMAAARSRRTAGEDDVPDPVSFPLEAHQETGEVIAGALIPLLDRIAGLLDGSPAPSEGSRAQSVP
jgi:protein-tyrosine phosphatase